MKTNLSIVVLAALNLSGCGKAEKTVALEDQKMQTISVERGEYLVKTIGCTDCHSPKVMTDHGPIPDEDRFLSGHPSDDILPTYDPDAAQEYVLFSMGFTAAVGPWGTSFSANLTPDPTGIGNWTEEQFLKALKEGQWRGMEGTRKLLPPMPWENYRELTDDDLKSIYAYLKTIPPIENVVPNAIPPGM